MIVSEAGREVRSGMAAERIGKGRAGVAVEVGKPFGEHAANEVPLIGEWLGARLYGTAKNAAPDGGPAEAGAAVGPVDEGPER